MSASDPLFWSALEFYVESFPREEREPLSRIAAVASGSRRFCAGARRRVHFGIADVGGLLGGIRYFSYERDARLGFFIYLAVDPAFRRQGIGEKLVEFGRGQCEKDAQEMGSELDAIVFECERPELAGTQEEKRVREDRLAYFVKRGARVVSRDYYQPALGPDRAAVPLYLMAYPLKEGLDWSRVVVQFHRSVLGYAPGSEEELRALKAMVP